MTWTFLSLFKQKDPAQSKRTLHSDNLKDGPFAHHAQGDTAKSEKHIQIIAEKSFAHPVDRHDPFADGETDQHPKDGLFAPSLHMDSVSTLAGSDGTDRLADREDAHFGKPMHDPLASQVGKDRVPPSRKIALQPELKTRLIRISDL